MGSEPTTSFPPSISDIYGASAQWRAWRQERAPASSVRNLRQVAHLHRDRVEKPEGKSRARRERQGSGHASLTPSPWVMPEPPPNSRPILLVYARIIKYTSECFCQQLTQLTRLNYCSGSGTHFSRKPLKGPDQFYDPRPFLRQSSIPPTPPHRKDHPPCR